MPPAPSAAIAATAPTSASHSIGAPSVTSTMMVVWLGWAAAQVRAYPSAPSSAAAVGREPVGP